MPISPLLLLAPYPISLFSKRSTSFFIPPPPGCRHDMISLRTVLGYSIESSIIIHSNMLSLLILDLFCLRPGCFCTYSAQCMQCIESASCCMLHGMAWMGSQDPNLLTQDTHPPPPTIHPHAHPHHHTVISAKIRPT